MISLNVAVNAKNVSLKLNNKYIVSNISFEIPNAYSKKNSFSPVNSLFPSIQLRYLGCRNCPDTPQGEFLSAVIGARTCSPGTCMHCHIVTITDGSRST